MRRKHFSLFSCCVSTFSVEEPNPYHPGNGPSALPSFKRSRNRVEELINFVGNKFWVTSEEIYRGEPKAELRLNQDLSFVA
jgi:hypothetical protein